VQDGDHDYTIALALTSDRASVMEGVRAGFIGAEGGLGPESQTRLLPATSVFERVIWLANRYAIALDRQGASDQQVSQAAADRPLFPVAAAPVSRVA
jgi:hypothetical protein